MLLTIFLIGCFNIFVFGWDSYSCSSNNCVNTTLSFKTLNRSPIICDGSSSSTRCYNLILLCPEDMESCELRCSNANSCNNVTIYTAAKYSNDVNCAATGACNNVSMYCGNIKPPGESFYSYNPYSSIDCSFSCYGGSSACISSSFYCTGNIDTCEFSSNTSLNTGTTIDCNITSSTKTCNASCTATDSCLNTNYYCDILPSKCACNGNYCNDISYRYLPGYSPTSFPTKLPTFNPTYIPTNTPTFNPTYRPTNRPTYYPTSNPTILPTLIPTNIPSNIPTYYPTKIPTILPTNIPTILPTNIPTILPTILPTNTPTILPTNTPTILPTNTPTMSPTNTPTMLPTNTPTMLPTNIPTILPTNMPTITQLPTNNPTVISPTNPEITSIFSSTLTPTFLNYTSKQETLTSEKKGKDSLQMVLIIVIIALFVIFSILLCLVFLIYYQRKTKKNLKQNILSLSTQNYENEMTKTSTPISTTINDKNVNKKSPVMVKLKQPNDLNQETEEKQEIDNETDNDITTTTTIKTNADYDEMSIAIYTRESTDMPLSNETNNTHNNYLASIKNNSWLPDGVLKPRSQIHANKKPEYREGNIVQHEMYNNGMTTPTPMPMPMPMMMPMPMSMSTTPIMFYPQTLPINGVYNQHATNINNVPFSSTMTTNIIQPLPFQEHNFQK